MANHRGIDDERRRAIGARLSLAWKESRYREDTLVALGKRLGVSHMSAKNWTSGEKLPSVEHCIALAKLFNISLDWLLLDRGSMRPNTVRGETVYIGDWPESAKGVVRGLVTFYNESENANAK